MSVSTRRFLRDFPLFRKQAERGETVVIESRQGTKFAFHRCGASPVPRRVDVPLPHAVTDKWDVDSPGILSDTDSVIRKRADLKQAYFHQRSRPSQ